MTQALFPDQDYGSPAAREMMRRQFNEPVTHSEVLESVTPDLVDARRGYVDWIPFSMADLSDLEFQYHGQPACLVGADAVGGGGSYWMIRVNGGRPVSVASTVCRKFVDAELQRRAGAAVLEAALSMPLSIGGNEGGGDAVLKELAESLPQSVNEIIERDHMLHNNGCELLVDEKEFEASGRLAEREEARVDAHRAQSAKALRDLDATSEEFAATIDALVKRTGRHTGNPRNQRRDYKSSAQASIMFPGFAGETVEADIVRAVIDNTGGSVVAVEQSTTNVQR